MVQKKPLKRLDRRQPEPLPLLPSLGKDSATDKTSMHSHSAISSTSNPTATASKTKANRKRGQMSKSLARAKLEKGVELADRLRKKANKRQHQVEKKKRAKES